MKRGYAYRQISVDFVITGKIKPDSVAYFLSQAIYEPVKRNHDGWRYHRHRFAIKNGLTHSEVLLRQLAEPDKIYRHFFGDNL